MSQTDKPDKTIEISHQKLLYNNTESEIFTFRDTTKQVEIRTVQEQNKTTNLLVSSVTHELITPLRCIVSMTDQLFETRTLDNFVDKNLNKKIVMIRNTAKLLLS